MASRVLLLIICCVVVVSAFRFPLTNKLVKSQNFLCMSSNSVIDKQKHATLGNVKGRYIGREDLHSMQPELDDELNDYNAFAQADDEEIDPPKKGQTITGTIIEMDDNGALLEIGGKMSGYLPLKEASLSPIKHVNMLFSVGQDITGDIIGSLKGMPVMSLRSSQLTVAWENALKMRATEEAFDVKIIEVNRGGAVCDAFGLKAFLPGSHYIGIPDASLIGTTLKVKFLDANEDEGKLVVSQKLALSGTNNTDLKKGEVIAGTITGLRPYGAFLELEGGLAGLLHISQISYDRIENLESLFSIGQKCKVMILDYDRVNNRVALSTKNLEANPGDMLKDMNSVFENAEETAKKYQARVESERLAREASAKDIVASLGGAIDDSNSANLASVADSIESILASIVSANPPGVN